MCESFQCIVDQSKVSSCPSYAQEAIDGAYQHRLTCAISKDEGATWQIISAV